jgi:hypothetical protein
MDRAHRWLVTLALLSGCSPDPRALDPSRYSLDAILVIATLLLVHAVVMALALAPLRRSWRMPEGTHFVVVIASLTPLVCNAGMCLFPPSSGADGLGGVMPGLCALATLPIAWLGLIGVALREHFAAR